MRTRVFLPAIVLISFAAWAADSVQRLDVKLGLWEVTHTTALSGMPPIPPEALASMTPEQRARFEATMKSSMSDKPKTTTEKSCETKEKLDKQMLFDDKNKECTRTVVKSSGSVMEMKIQCDHQGMKSEGTFRVEAINAENVKGSMHMTSTGGGHAMNINSDFTGHWLGPVCGDVK